MRIRTAALAAIAALALAGCSTTATPDGTAPPTPAPSPSSSAPPAAAADTVTACVDAIASNPDGARPAECASLTESEYLDAQLKGVQQANQAGRDTLQDAIENATKSP